MVSEGVGRDDPRTARGTEVPRTGFEGNFAINESAVAPVSGEPTAPVRSSAPGTLVGSIVQGLRPRQWAKNVLVFAVPLASGSIAQPRVLLAVLVAFVLFCLVSGGVYLINDVRDADADRQHPRKRFRPVASGALPPRVAVAVAVVLLAGSLAAAVLLTRPALAGVLGAYVAISVCYSLFLKDQPVIDLAVVASGFLLRGVAGGAAAGIAPSQWFLLVASFGALFIVAGKRYAEILAMGEGAGATRKSLVSYSASYLRFVWSMSAGVTCTVYCLWAFELRDASGVPWTTISIAPFVLGLLRYAVDVDRGTAGAPEDILLRDRFLVGIGVVWAVVFSLGVIN
ncbi:decaprenyl-phosphate phosphoribosyltransferase [Petropleomorpha daqingensis]|uniref:Decaprenyl-phosphate phosphoribosyltransferase n=1 Tax=Petropleomorpha daqingensis TaxID=2026353 RepID=A0A853CEV2_9ACTN|nr:decaprenyl-phosphate phosphoribosyltransferase [Petropleomorpha daqingensis]NYJ04643.1 decaprenyl-phosphate phosphoribosyltransferase [Petropleomorpha daqingensis]